MPLTQLNTSWSVEELFSQAISLVGDDTNWLVQTQSANSLVLRREKDIALWKILVLGFLTLITLGCALIFLPVLFIGFSNQQIVINAKTQNGKTSASINYTKGANKVVQSLIQMAAPA